jgi:hypothetical protein
VKGRSEGTGIYMTEGRAGFIQVGSIAETLLISRRMDGVGRSWRMRICMKVGLSLGCRMVRAFIYGLMGLDMRESLRTDRETARACLVRWMGLCTTDSLLTNDLKVCARYLCRMEIFIRGTCVMVRKMEGEYLCLNKAKEILMGIGRTICSSIQLKYDFYLYFSFFIYKIIK